MGDLPAEPRRVFGLSQQRQKAVEILNHCYTADLLDLAELENRLALVERAATLDDLDRVLADVPEEYRRSGVASVGLSDAESVVCKMSNKTVADGLLLTKVFRAEVSMGKLVLDYRNLPLPEGNLEVQLQVSMGNCLIRLPDGVLVENRLKETMSTVRERPDVGARARPMTVLRLTGEVNMSSVKVHRRGRLAVWLDRVRGPRPGA